jgi:hypothetical protein
MVLGVGLNRNARNPPLDNLLKVLLALELMHDESVFARVPSCATSRLVVILGRSSPKVGVALPFGVLEVAEWTVDETAFIVDRADFVGGFWRQVGDPLADQSIFGTGNVLRRVRIGCVGQLVQKLGGETIKRAVMKLVSSLLRSTMQPA